MTRDEPAAVARLRLRLALHRAREAKRLTQRQVASALEWSLAKVNRIEAGDVTISITDLHALLQLLEVTEPGRVEELTEIARAARRRGWWNAPEFRANLTPAMIESLQFELAASAIRSFQPSLVPGLLQTRDYATAVLADLGRDLAEEVRSTRLEVRLRRRDQLLDRPDPPEQLLILDESVLLREVGGARITSEQLYELLAQAQAGRVTVRVLPLAAGAGYAQLDLFMIYDTDDKDVALLYRERRRIDEAVYDLAVIQRHRQLFAQIWEQSWGVEASMHEIEARAAALRAAADRTGPGG